MYTSIVLISLRGGRICRASSKICVLCGEFLYYACNEQKLAPITSSGVGSNLQVAGAECRREAPGEIFLMCPLTFLLCPPHEGAQRLFVTDWETIEVVKSGELGLVHTHILILTAFLVRPLGYKKAMGALQVK